MKIEKVNDHQIRCTLTKADLADRELKISELAYGTEKAKNLFRDMMQQASYEFGFDADDIPLMIEAIPLNSECIVLVITKVEDPEELDTRFSKFAPSATDDDDDEYEDTLSGMTYSVKFTMARLQTPLPIQWMRFRIWENKAADKAVRVKTAVPQKQYRVLI